MRLAAGLAWIATAATLGLPGASAASPARLEIPTAGRQLVVVSSPSDEPARSIAVLRAYVRVRGSTRWRPVFGPWPAETGRGGLIAAARRREGDGATPTGVFAFGPTIYGDDADPGGLHSRYHRLVCGDWWDEDPYSPRYNRFVHVRCGVRPAFAASSEALWTETVAYPYFAVIDFNIDPLQAGASAAGSGIFLHSWIGVPTHGCVALPVSRLVAVLRWLRPALHPVVEIGTQDELARL
ncbi:MAG: L,D-transpeptidase family protein [Solirubrobacteraceae bacterium]